VFIPYNQFVGHFVKRILLVFQSCLLTLCRLLHNTLPHFLPSSFLCHFQSLLVFLTLHCPVWATAGLFLHCGLPVTGLPTFRTVVFLTSAAYVINKALRSLQFLSSLYKVGSLGALEEYFTVVGWSKVLLFLISYNKNQRDALFLNFILVKNSTCFRQIYCPSCGVSILYSQQ